MKIGCLTFTDGRGEEQRVLLKNLSVYEAGKAQGNHIQIRHPGVAYNHFRIYYSDGKYSLYDLGSKYGTYLNGERIEKAALKPGDVIRAGEVELRFDLVDETASGRLASCAPDSDEADAQARVGGLLTKTRASVPTLVVIDGEDRGKRLPLTGKTKFKVGRSTKSDLRLVDSKVSREHCLIEQVEGHHVIIDLESANGTVVNGDRVKKTVLKEGDFIRLGFTMLKYDRL